MTTIDVKDEAGRLDAFFDASARLLDESDERLQRPAPDVSAWSPAQHLYHTWAAAGKMLAAVLALHQGRGPIVEDDAPNRVGRLVLEQGRFLRGRAQSPEGLVPPEAPTRAQLQDALARSRRKGDQVQAALADLDDTDGRIEHPILGPLSATEWMRVVRIHSEHHLAILRDILDT